MVVFVERGDATASMREIAFILADAPDLGTLLEGLRPDVGAVVVDAFGDGLSIIAAALAGRRGLDAVHIVSHGEPGMLHLGRLALDAAALEAHGAEVAALGDALAPGGEILLYGCDVARGAEGRAFVEAFADLAGANVSASDDATGDLTRGGDWDLEFTVGARAAAGAFTAEAMAGYRGLLDSNNYVMVFTPDNLFMGAKVRDGDLSSTDVPDVTYEISGGGVMWVSHEGLGSVMPAEGETPSTIYIRTVEGSQFSLQTIQIHVLDVAQTSVWIEGFRDGVSTGAAVKAILPSNGIMLTSQQLIPSQFENVDEVRLTNPDGAQAGLNGNALMLNYLTFGPAVVDNVKPDVDAVDTTAQDGAYKSGAIIDIQITYNEEVFVTGNPSLELNSGGTATYLSGSGGKVLTFRYEVGPNDTAASLDAVYQVALNGGSIKDAAGNDAATAVPVGMPPVSLSSQSDIVIDNIAPALDDTGVPSGGTYKTDETLSFTVKFDEAVNVDVGGGSPYIALTLGSGGETLATYKSGSGTDTLTFAYKIQKGDSDADGVQVGGSITLNGGTIRDAAGNNAPTTGLVFGSTAGVLVDTAVKEPAPSLDAESDTGLLGDKITADATPTLKGVLQDWGVVEVFDGATSLGNAVLTPVGEGAEWSFTPTVGLSDGLHSLSAVIRDKGGVQTGSIEPLVFTVDTKGPKVTISAGETTLAPGATTKLTFTFDEAPKSFGVNDITVNGGKIGTISSSIDHKTYTATFTPSGEGSSATIDISGVHVLDVAGNQGASVAPLKITTNYVAPQPQPPAPPPVTEAVDGVSVGKTTTTNADGTTSQTVTIPVVTDSRPETVGGNTVADIPLVGGTGGALLTAQVPTGLGLQITGFAAPKSAGNSLTDLIREIQANTPNGSAVQTAMTGGGSGFLSGLSADTPLIVQTIVPTMAPGGGVAGPLVFTGTPSTNPVSTALVINASNLPAGTALQLQNVEFAAIIGAVNVTGGAGSQNVWGDGASQTLYLGDDDDVLHGGAGGDTVGSATGHDQLFGDEGEDSVFGGEGNDYLHGNAGSDTVSGDAGDDRAYGGQDADVITGGEGADQVFGDLGDDRLQGNIGSDFLNGGHGADTVMGGQGGDTALGGADADFVSGDLGDDYVQGNAGNDTVDGGAGHDILLGGQNEDVLSGGIGNDTLSGDNGNDWMSGGAGADRFAFATGSGIDVIADFSFAEGDRIMLSNVGYGTVGQVLSHVTADAYGNAVIGLGDGQQVTLIGVSSTSVTADFFA